LQAPAAPEPASGCGPPVFLAPAGSLSGPGETVVLTGPEGRHAAAVRRLRAGERADLSDGAGTLACGVVTSVDPESVAVCLRSTSSVPPPSPRITVVQALAKGDRGELAVEMMTEVGVDHVVAWSAARSVTRWEGTRGERSLAKWRAAAREAAKQSRRAWIPAVEGPATLAGVAALVSRAACSVVLAPDGAAPLSRLALPAAGDVVLVVGPEGGVSPAERSELAAAGATEARLGPTVLRTSTAGSAAAALLLSRCGRW
jgi:16S rRNA (uracil1498-N3)-methyltransferase